MTENERQTNIEMVLGGLIAIGIVLVGLVWSLIK